MTNIARQLEQAKARLDATAEQRFATATARTLGVPEPTPIEQLAEALRTGFTALAAGLRPFMEALIAAAAPLVELATEIAERRRLTKLADRRAQAEVTRRLRLAGITKLVPRTGGVTPLGYYTIDEPTRLMRGDELATTFHPWRIPAAQVRGILAAVKAADRAAAERRKVEGR